MKGKTKTRLVITLITVYLLVVAMVILTSKWRQGDEEIRQESENQSTGAPEPIARPVAGKTIVSSSLPYAPLPEVSTAYTTVEMIEQSQKQGAVFCESMERDSDRKDCLKHYYTILAERNEDPTICEKLTEPDFREDCKKKAAVTAVALAYIRGVRETGNEEFVPENLWLCDSLFYDKDRSLCQNPKQAVEKNYNEVVYKST